MFRPGHWAKSPGGGILGLLNTFSRFMKRFLFLFFLAAPGVSAQPFDGLSAAIEAGDFGNVRAVVVSRHGEIIYEDYFRGTGVDDLHQVQSVTKSVGSALLGVAHRQGLLELDDTLERFFSGLYDMSVAPRADKRSITLEQLVTHRLGIVWDETSFDYRNVLNSANQMAQTDDWYHFVLRRPLAEQPGENFRYNTGAASLLSRVVRVASGVGPDEYAREALFDPLGFGPVHWEMHSEGGLGTGSTDWPNPDDDPTLGVGLYLRARDMLKFGELYLNGGVHQGRRILDESWVNASWTRHSHAGNSTYLPDRDWGFGYQWWQTRFEDGTGRSWHTFFSSGWGGQVIFVVPELDLVVVTAADNYNYGGPDMDVLLSTWILPELDPRMDARFSGSWYDPATDGQGFSMEVLEERDELVAWWYTYTESGEQRWFLLQGPLSQGIGEVTIYQAEGGRFLQGDPVSLSAWGAGRFMPRSCDRMDFEVESAEVSTMIELTRLTGTCFQPPE